MHVMAENNYKASVADSAAWKRRQESKKEEEGKILGDRRRSDHWKYIYRFCPRSGLVAPSWKAALNE